MTSVLLTRSEDENLLLAAKLKNLGFRCIYCPMVEYRDFLIDYSFILKNYSDIIITSKYAAKKISNFIAQLTEGNTNYRTINFWLVGKESARILSPLDRVVIKYVAENVENLIIKIPPSTYNHSIYLSADNITMPMPPKIMRLIIYQVLYKLTLNQELKEEFIAGVDYILLYSKNCADKLIRLLDKYYLINQLKNTIIITISSAVAVVVRPYFSNVHCVSGSEQQQMIDLLICDARRNKKTVLQK